MSQIKRKQDKIDIFQSVKKSNKEVVASITPKANQKWQLLNDLGLKNMSPLARYGAVLLFATRSNDEKITRTARKLDLFSTMGIMASSSTFNAFPFADFETIEVSRQFDFEPIPILKKAFDFQDILDYLEYRNRHNYVNYILIAGITGSGKSNTSLTIAKEMMRRLNMKFKLEEHIQLSRALDLSLESLTNTYKENTYLVVEEAEWIINRMRANSQQNVETKNTLDTIRDAKINFIFNCPHLNQIDSHVVNNQIDILITAYHNDAQRKEIHTVIEVNVRDIKLTIQQYIEHSKRIFPYLPLSYFKKYQKIKKQKIYAYENRIIDYDYIRKQQKKKAKIHAQANQIQDYIEFIRENKDKLSKKRLAIEGFLRDIPQSTINELLRTHIGEGFSWAKMKALSDQSALVKANLMSVDEILREEEREKGGEQSY